MQHIVSASTYKRLDAPFAKALHYTYSGCHPASFIYRMRRLNTSTNHNVMLEFRFGSIRNANFHAAALHHSVYLCLYANSEFECAAMVTLIRQVLIYCPLRSIVGKTRECLEMRFRPVGFLVVFIHHTRTAVGTYVVVIVAYNLYKLFPRHVAPGHFCRGFP